MGKGINISQGGNFGTERSFQFMLQNIRYWHNDIKSLPYGPKLEEIRQYRIAQLPENMTASILFRLKHRQPLQFKASLNLPLITLYG